MDFDAEASFFEIGHGFVTLTRSTCSRCRLCNLDILCSDWARHIEEESHMSNLRALRKVADDELVLYRRRIEALSWKARISSLHPASTEDICKAMFDYLTDISVGSAAVTILLDRCEAVERAVLIELVAWKATCIMSAPSDMIFRSVLDCHAWTKLEWKKSKEGLKESPSIAIILSNVASYLGAECGSKYRAAATNKDTEKAKTKGKRKFFRTRCEKGRFTRQQE
jgi:hypothetical protein